MATSTTITYQDGLSVQKTALALTDTVSTAAGVSLFGGRGPYPAEVSANGALTVTDPEIHELLLRILLELKKLNTNLTDGEI